MPTLISQKKDATKSKKKDATKTPRHQEPQRFEYQFNSLSESFVPWCLGGKKSLVSWCLGGRKWLYEVITNTKI
jgi:hypothetical protein